MQFIANLVAARSNCFHDVSIVAHTDPAYLVQ